MEFTIQEMVVIFLAIVLIVMVMASTLQGGTGLQGINDFFAELFGSEKGHDLTIENLRAENLRAIDTKSNILFDVKNAGNVDLPAGSLYSIKLFLDGELVHTWEPDKNIAKLPRGDKYELNRRLEIPRGEHEIRVVVDAGKQIEELDEENNRVGIMVKKNWAPKATIDKIGDYDVPEEGAHLEGPVSGTVTIQGTASDPDGNDEIVSVKINADWGTSYSLYLKEATYDKDTGEWEIEWDTTKKLDYGGGTYDSYNKEYHIVAIVEDSKEDYVQPDAYINIYNERH